MCYLAQDNTTADRSALYNSFMNCLAFSGDQAASQLRLQQLIFSSRRHHIRLSERLVIAQDITL